MKTITTYLTLIIATVLLGSTAAKAQCSPSFTWTQTSNNVIAFTNTSTPMNANTSFTWSFGDTQYDYTVSPTHTYANPGGYTVTLYMYDSLQNCQMMYADTISVTGTQLSCNASFTWSQIANNTLNFTSTSTGINSNTNYYWSFGDGNFAYTQNSQNFYTTPGSYIVCLTIYDSANCQSTVCDTVVVTGNQTACNAMFTWAQIANNTASFTSTSTGVTGSTSYYWNFGDGGFAYTQNAQHQYANAGSYVVCLTISDSATSCQSTYCDTISIIMGIHSYEQSSHWNIYPNPATDVINLNMDATVQGKTFIISDISGRKVMTGKIEGKSISISSLDAGTYMLQIETENNLLTAQRFIKN